MNYDDQVFDYLNGWLDEPARVAFEKQLKQNESLAALVDEVNQEMALCRESYHQMAVPKLTASIREKLITRAAPARYRRPRWHLMLPVLGAAILLLALLPLAFRSAAKPAGVRLVVTTPNPKIVIYVVDQLPESLWQGDEP